MAVWTAKQEKDFCRAFLQSMDPERAAREAGVSDGYAMLNDARMQKKLKKAREAMGNAVRKEDVLRRLCELAFGRANDAVKLACGADAADKQIEDMELSAVAEFKRGSGGAVEVKLADRVKALETLYRLLSEDGDGSDEAAADFLRALEGMEEEN